MNRNLITRMGTASGVVAALVATVFAVLVTAVRDQRDSTEAARRSQQLVNASSEAREDLIAVDLGRRGGLANAPDVRAAGRELRVILEQRLPPLVDGNAEQAERVSNLAAAPENPAGRAMLNEIISTEQANVERRREEADRKAKQAIALGIGGLIGSALLIALLTTYLTRYIVVPVRRTAKAAHRLATGDMSARVPEEGDAEPVELARAFNTMAFNLQEGERLKDEFFALVSHELRTPLTSIIGYLELVLDDEEELSDDARRFLEVVERNAKRLLRLVGDMLFIAQVEAGRLSLESHPLDLTQIAGESVEAARPAAERSSVTLSLRAEPVKPMVGDRDRFGQMIDNLVSNALKFTPEAGRVDVVLTDGGDHACVEVSDTGMGIPDEEQKRLFERFFRSASATARAVPGAGLGLTIVKTIVEAHGGTIDLTSQEGEGTTVRVKLPYPRAEAAA
ncbi:MAG: sensor histidine kinase [Solirubrobacteraceae bacterium]